LLCAGTVLAQPAGWSSVTQLTVTENSGAALTDYPVLVTIDTASLIAGGLMRVDAGDLRFGSDSGGVTLLNHWVDSGVNTASTTVFVRVPSLPANGEVIIYMFYGNPAATDASALSTFDGPYSATNQVTGGSTNTVSNSQRGFRFSPNVPILVTRFGKNEPTGTTRYVTMFDVATQAIVHQQQVTGAAGTYSYQDITPPPPFWLTAGDEYILEIFQGVGDGYYFQTSSQINSYLTYYDMRYCNGCTENTFPTSALGNYHYGYPDLEFWARQTVDPAPTVEQLQLGSIPTLDAWGRAAFVTVLGLVALLMMTRRRRSSASTG
jgi:hypothetical protein